MLDKAFFNWSGGKDSALALYHVLQSKTVDVQLLLTTVNDNVNRITSHGVRAELLYQQVERIGIPFCEVRLPDTVTMEEYNNIMHQSVNSLVELKFRHAIFGDIFLEDLRTYREQHLAPFGMQISFPLWQRDTKELLSEFLDLGFKTIVVCVKADSLDKSFAGRVIDRDFINDLPLSVDPCGENGEFHTFVFDGPIFKNPVDFAIGECVYKEYEAPKTRNENGYSETQAQQFGFWFCDLIPPQLVMQK